MTIDVNNQESYIEIGTGYDEEFNLINSLKLPAPTSFPFTSEYFVDASRNAEGTMILQQIGRSQEVLKIKWTRMKSYDFWRMNRWFEKYGYVFYVKFFNHMLGTIQMQRFYKGKASEAEPSEKQQIIDGISVPCYYRNIEFSIIDMGENEVMTLYQLEVT